jgi:H+-transporting ATPase
LVRFVDTYRDPNAENDGRESLLDEELGAKAPWWAFWRKGNSRSKARFSEFETPGDWLNTDLRDGLIDAEVDRRRKHSGWNELSTEKENMLLKFIGFFRGPILYGLPLAICSR